MMFLLCIAMLGLCAGCFMLFNISPFDFADSLIKVITHREPSIKTKVKEAKGQKKAGYLKRELAEAKAIMGITNRSDKFSLLCIVAFVLLIAGAFISLVIGNVFLLPILAVGLFFVPFWYIKLTASHYKKHLNAELETALSIVTISYLRNDDIITAIDENISYLNPPVSDIFRGFVTQTLINPNVTLALKNMKTKIENHVFHEWIDALIACQSDRNLKSTLSPIISKLSDMRIVSGELEYFLFEPRKEFITMALLLVGNIPLMYFINHSRFETLMFTTVGKAVLAISAVVMFISFSAMIKLTKPVEYNR